MTIHFDLTREISGVQVAFHGDEADAASALSAINVLLGVGAATNVTPAKAPAEKVAEGNVRADASPTTQQSQASAQTGGKSSNESTASNASTSTDHGDAIVYTYDAHIKPVIIAMNGPVGSPSCEIPGFGTATTLGDREKLIALLARHGVKKGPDLNEDQFSDFLADARRAMDGHDFRSAS